MDVRSGFDLTGKVAIVTGAGMGIGAASATLLGDAGATVVVTDLNAENATTTAKSIEEAGGKAVAARLDVTDRGAFSDLINQTVAAHGALDILVNNAGFSRPRPIMEVPYEEFQTALDVNLLAVFHATQEAVKVMQPGSSIINVLSSIIDNVTPGNTAYAAAKMGAWALTRGFAREVGSRGIRINAIAPGFTTTFMSQGSSTDDDGVFDPAAYEDMIKRMQDKAALGTVGEPMDQGYAVLFLASPASKFMSGQVLRVNGGTTMP